MINKTDSLKLPLKNIFALIFLFVTVSVSAQTSVKDSYEIIYEYRYQPNKEDTLKRSEQMVLFKNNEESVFQSYPMYQKDSLLYTVEKNGLSPMDAFARVQQLRRNKINYILKKDFNAQEYTIIDKVMRDSYSYREKMHGLDWLPLNGTSIIGDLVCKSAKVKFGGREFIAWYAEDIPVQDGPYKFYGLPGLIVRVYDSEQQFDFTMKSIRDFRKFQCFA